ncbi:hypothetical protein D920_02001 [Enterococcus faecalis 13-SD-W-01]|nr:hypothetical protein D920_02001 [Enterococcus faecalis 13-SD-W-01]
MIRNKNKTIFTIFISSLILTILSQINLMEADAASGAGFTMQAVIPENQRTDVTFFDLLVQPNLEQELSIIVQNLEEHPITVVVSPNDSFTNNNGLIEYTKRIAGDEYVHSSALRFSDVVVDEEIEKEIPALEEAEFQFTIQMSEESYKGTVLGGFYATRTDEQEAEVTEVSQGMSIQNKFALVLGIRLQEEEELSVLPDLELAGAGASLSDGLGRIHANLNLKQPTILTQMNVEARVYKDGELRYERSAENQQMAPLSNYNFQIPVSEDGIIPGDYVMRVAASTEEHQWDFEKEFTITVDDANNVNDQSLLSDQLRQRDLMRYLLMALIALVVLLTGIIIWILVKRKKSSK